MKSHYAAVLLTLLPVLYVLSTGPVIMMDLQLNTPPLGIPSTGVLTFYAPLVWLGDHVPPVGFVVGKYVKLWRSRQPGP
jgi:hypothetical protein